MNRKHERNSVWWINVLECLVWLVALLFVLCGILLAMQTKNLFLILMSAAVLLVIGLTAIAAMKVLVGMAKDLRAIRRMLNEQQDSSEQLIRHRRSAGYKTTKEEGIL